MSADVASAAPRDRSDRLWAFLAAAGPRVLYGLRMMGSVTLAMWVAFWLELEHAYWAPLTAAIVCQPTIGASLRKGQFRIIGTLTGAFMIVVLTGLMPQSRIALLGGLTAWAMLAGVGATLLRNSAAYAASLAGYTAVIVFADAVGSAPQDTFVLAITRATEISIGVLSAGLVLAATDTGDARRRLMRSFGEIVAGIAAGLAQTVSISADDLRERRRLLIGKLAALDPLIDEALGETADLRYHSHALTAGVEGILRALSAWRSIADHADAVHARVGAAGPIALPDELGAIGRLDWSGDPAGARRHCVASARRALARPAASVSARLVADRSAEALLGLSRAANAMALLGTPREAIDDHRRSRVYVPDVLPVIVNGARVGLAVTAAAAFWIELAWPGGQGALTFAAVVTILFAPQADKAVGIVRQFGLGVAFAAILGGIAEFAILPDQQSFVALNLVIGAVMIPAAAMAAGTWNKFFFTAITFIFLALLAPANRQTYDLAGYINQAGSIVVGIVSALLAFRLIPPPSGALRTRRLLALTLRDTRRFAAGRRLRSQRSWLGLQTARIGALPAEAMPVDRARLVAGFAAGTSLLWLRQETTTGLAGRTNLAGALSAYAAGDPARAIGHLRALDASQPDGPDALRVRAEIVLLTDLLIRHRPYFEDRHAQEPGR